MLGQNGSIATSSTAQKSVDLSQVAAVFRHKQNANDHFMLPVDAQRGDNPKDTLKYDIKRQLIAVKGEVISSLEDLETRLSDMGINQDEKEVLFRHYSQKPAGHANSFLVESLGGANFLPEKANANYVTDIAFDGQTREFILRTSVAFNDASSTKAKFASSTLPNSGGTITEEIRLQTDGSQENKQEIDNSGQNTISPFYFKSVQGSGFVFDVYCNGAEKALSARPDKGQLDEQKAFQGAKQVKSAMKYEKIVSLLQGIDENKLSQSPRLNPEQKGELLALKAGVLDGTLTDKQAIVGKANQIVGNRFDNGKPGQSYYLLVLLGQYQADDKSGLWYLCDYYDSAEGSLTDKEKTDHSALKAALDRSEDQVADTETRLLNAFNLPLSQKQYNAVLSSIAGQTTQSRLPTDYAMNISILNRPGVSVSVGDASHRYSQSKNLYARMLTAFKVVVPASSHNAVLLEITQQRIASHEAILTQMENCVNSEQEGNADPILDIFADTLDMQTAVLKQAILDLNPSYDFKSETSVKLTDKESERIQSAFDKAPRIFMELAAIPKANKVLGTVLATTSYVAGLTAAAALVGLAIVTTFGLAAIPLAVGLGALGVGAFGSTVASAVKSHSLLTKPTEGVSPAVAKQVSKANSGFRDEVRHLNSPVEEQSNFTFFRRARQTLGGRVSEKGSKQTALSESNVHGTGLSNSQLTAILVPT